MDMNQKSDCNTISNKHGLYSQLNNTLIIIDKPFNSPVSLSPLTARTYVSQQRLSPFSKFIEFRLVRYQGYLNRLIIIASKEHMF